MEILLTSSEPRTLFFAFFFLSRLSSKVACILDFELLLLELLLPLELLPLLLLLLLLLPLTAKSAAKSEKGTFIFHIQVIPIYICVH